MILQWKLEQTSKDGDSFLWGLTHQRRESFSISYYIVEPVFGGLGPATYRSAEAPVVSEVRRGARDTYAEYESPTLCRKQWWCMHGTRGSTHTVTRNSPSPLQPKNQASGRLERAARTRSCRRAAEHGSGFMILEYKTAQHKQATLRSVPKPNYKRPTSTAPMLARKLLKTNQAPPQRGASAEAPAKGRSRSAASHRAMHTKTNARTQRHPGSSRPRSAASARCSPRMVTSMAPWPERRRRVAQLLGRHAAARPTRLPAGQLQRLVGLAIVGAKAQHVLQRASPRALLLLRLRSRWSRRTGWAATGGAIWRSAAEPPPHHQIRFQRKHARLAAPAHFMEGLRESNRRQRSLAWRLAASQRLAARLA
jgi:hypothetical protein